MTYEQRRTTVERGDVNQAPDGGLSRPQLVEERDTTTYRPSGSTLASRVVIVVFGTIEALLLIRIVLLALDAQRANAVVAAVLATTQVVVAPFEGMFKTDALSAGKSVIDIAAIAALIAVAIVEFVVLAIVRIPRRREDL